MEPVLPYSKSVFLNILYPASANEFSAYGNSIFLVGAILHILTNVTDFLASGNHFLSFFQTKVNCCQWKRLSRLVETSFLSTANSILFYSAFFLLVEIITETWGKSIFKDEIYSC